MNKKLFVRGIIILLLIGGGFLGYQTLANNTSSDYTSQLPAIPTETDSKVFTLAEVATHRNATSCYTVISGSVYDLTLWVNLHPGGEKEILSICGIDGTEIFIEQHHAGKKFMSILSHFIVGKIS